MAPLLRPTLLLALSALALSASAAPLASISEPELASDPAFSVVEAPAAAKGVLMTTLSSSIVGSASNCAQALWVEVDTGALRAKFLAKRILHRQEDWSAWRGCGSRLDASVWSLPREASAPSFAPSVDLKFKADAPEGSLSALVGGQPPRESDDAVPLAKALVGSEPSGRLCLRSAALVQAYGITAWRLPNPSKRPACSEKAVPIAPATSSEALRKLAVAAAEACAALADQGLSRFGDELSCSVAP